MNWQHTSLPAIAAGVALGLGGVAQADEPAAPNPQSLATFDAILSRCAELDPGNAARYLGQSKILTQDANDDVVAKVRQSDEYKEAYDSAAQAAAAAKDKDSLQACKSSLAPGQ